MQTVQQTVAIVTYVADAPASRVNQFARALLDADILPKSSGRDIKKIGADKMLPLLAAVAMADKVSEAARVAAEFAALPMEGDGSPLADFFLTVLDQDSPWGSPQLEFAKTQNGYTATVSATLVDGAGAVRDVTLSFWRNRSWGSFCKRSFTISPEGMNALRGLFNRADIEGMQFRLSPEAQ